MTNKTNKNTQLTLASLLQKKAAKEAQEIRTKEVYVDSLEAEITLSAVKRNTVYKITDQALKEDTLIAKVYSNALLVYHAVSLFQHTDFVGNGDPVDAVNAVLEPYEINELADEIMKLSGFAKVEFVEDVKN